MHGADEREASEHLGIPKRDRAGLGPLFGKPMPKRIPAVVLIAELPTQKRTGPHGEGEEKDPRGEKQRRNRGREAWFKRRRSAILKIGQRSSPSVPSVQAPRAPRRSLSR
ncbi:MAG: hypothetical protein AMS20_05945 [Gemmatimonas sp. SG8_28]|nr:MAG: hypothetical protein AMS20_05945 [Gemmatimonas sp. SG8_28]